VQMWHYWVLFVNGVGAGDKKEKWHRVIIYSLPSETAYKCKHQWMYYRWFCGLERKEKKKDAILW
jgi:hypothetical protein